MPKPKESTDRNIRQKKTDSDEINLILSKTARISLFRRFRLKRNAPDDSKHYEITKQTHGACSVRNQTNGTPRFQRPSRATPSFFAIFASFCLHLKISFPQKAPIRVSGNQLIFIRVHPCSSVVLQRSQRMFRYRPNDRNTGWRLDTAPDN